ncbi:hypothetical protein MASR2M79_06590 [Aminivibrio sp.]
MDVNAVLRPIREAWTAPSCAARGKASLSGSLTPNVSYSGKGKATVGSGAMLGFRGLQVATLYGTSGVRYERVGHPLP